MMNRFDQNKLAFLSQYGKVRVVAAVPEPVLGCRLMRVEGFETKQIFSGCIIYLPERLRHC